MPKGACTIAFLICSKEGAYYAGDGWHKDIRRACLYTRIQAECKFKEILPGFEGSVILCVIQDKSFNFYDGNDFAYGLHDARLYGVEEAETVMRRLS